MNSTEIKADIEKVNLKIRDVERELKAPGDLERGLELQRELGTLQSYQTRLKALLETALSNEALAREKQARAELDTELDDLKAKYLDLDAETGQLTREIAPMLERACERYTALREQMNALERQHETTFYQRFKDYPGEQNTLRKLRSTRGDEPAQEVARFAVELLEHELSGHGYRLQDIHRALAQSRVYDVF